MEGEIPVGVTRTQTGVGVRTGGLPVDMCFF